MRLPVLADNGAVVLLDVEEARAIVNRIRQCVEIALVSITKAYDGRAWIALGYDSWAELCAAEFGEHVRLPRDERRAVVAELHQGGMSTRAIAAATGVDRKTIRADLSHVGEMGPPDAEVVGLDGKSYAPPPKRELTADEQARLDYESTIRTAAHRLEMFASSAHEFRGLRTDPRRDEILAALVESDRELILRYEKEIQWTI